MEYRDLENWYKFDFEQVGRYGVPQMHSVDVQQHIPFNYAKSCSTP